MKKKGSIIALVLGPALFFASYFLLPDTMFPQEARGAIGLVLWMAFWWITGPVDYAVTGFLPIAVNALFQLVDMSTVISNYASETILLLLGASILVVSWEITGLDKRISLKCLSLIGGKLSSQIVFWFILSGLLSSILPNAVVCATITPVAVSMLRFLGEGDIAKSKSGSLILLTIVYAAGAGGLASPLGGAMNLVTVDYIEQLTGEEYMYSSWVIRFLPIMILLFSSNIIYLVIRCKKGEKLAGSREYFAKLYKEMPSMTKEEVITLILFLVPTILSFCRQLYQDYLPGLKPAYWFVICAVISFFVKRKDGTKVLCWKEAEKNMGWDLIYVFAGGLALGAIVNGSGAAKCLGDLIAAADLDGGFFTVFIIVALTILLSDVTSNTATAAVSIPIVISIAQGIGKNPIPYIYIASIGINLSYMLPTSIRAIPVGYGLQPKYMLKQGVPLTIIMIISMSILGYLLLKYWPAFSTV